MAKSSFQATFAGFALISFANFSLAMWTPEDFSQMESIQAYKRGDNKDADTQKPLFSIKRSDVMDLTTNNNTGKHIFGFAVSKYELEELTHSKNEEAFYFSFKYCIGYTLDHAIKDHVDFSPRFTVVYIIQLTEEQAKGTTDDKLKVTIKQNNMMSSTGTDIEGHLAYTPVKGTLKPVLVVLHEDLREAQFFNDSNSGFLISAYLDSVFVPMYFNKTAAHALELQEQGRRGKEQREFDALDSMAYVVMTPTVEPPIKKRSSKTRKLLSLLKR